MLKPGHESDIVANGRRIGESRVTIRGRGGNQFCSHVNVH